MLPIYYHPFYPQVNPQLNLQQLYMCPTHPYFYPKETADKACQCPEPTTIKESPEVSQEEQVEAEMTQLLKYLSKNISLLKDSTFEEFARDYLKNLSNLHKDTNLPNLIKKRYIHVNKTKEEMTKFIIRRCFLFIKSSMNYQDQDGLPAEERDRLFYQTFFQQDEEFIEHLKQENESIDDLIPFRKDSKMKTMNDNYLKSLFQSKLFAKHYSNFIQHFKEICINENNEKIENMTKQMIKIIHTRDFGKIKTYRRFPWKDHELQKCEERVKELYKKYYQSSKKLNKDQEKKEKVIEKMELSCERTSESLYQQQSQS